MSAQLESTHFDAGDEKVKFSDLFEFRKVLGNGSFGVVVSALQKPFMRECAVKIIMKKSLRSRNLEDLRKESQILQQLDHPNIVKFIAIHESDTRIFIVMELVRDGQLQALIRERNKAGKPFSDEEASKLMRSIFAGLRYIHSKDVVHRDLKPENILLNDHNDLSSVKICDFGLSAQYDYATCTRSFKEKCGTDIYMAPELWKKRTYGKPVDMWSCGIIMYLLLSGGKHPLHKSGDNHETYLQKLEAAQWPMLPNFNRHSKDLFLKLVHSDPCERYTVEQMQDHPWITRRFHEDIPLTSSEKIAAFSHSQSLSQIIKSMYLMFALPNMPKTKLAEVPEESPKLEDKLKVDTKQNIGSDNSESTKSEEDISLKIPIIEEESPTQLSPDQSIQLKKAPSSTKDDLSPTPTGLTRKQLPSFSTQASTNPTTLQSLTKKDRDHSAVGSLAELETTQTSNPNSQQEEKNIKHINLLGADLMLHTEPSRSDDPKRLSRGAETKWMSDRETTVNNFANSFMKRKDLRSDKITEKILPGHVKDGYSFDLGYKLDASKSSTRLDTKDKEEKKYLSINDLGYGQPGGLINSHTLGDLGNTMLVTPTGQSTNKRRGEQDENSYAPLITMSEKKPGEISRQQMLKRKIRKGASDNAVGALPNVIKVKSRQASLPMKKKANPEKSVGRNQEIPQRALGATGYGARPNMLPGDATPARNLHDKRESSVKKVYDERKPGTAAPLEASRRTNSLLAACKTPQRDDKDEMPSLPLIKSETKKTKLGWMNGGMEKGVNVKTTSLFANMAGTMHRAPSKLVKAVVPFKLKD